MSRKCLDDVENRRLVEFWNVTDQRWDKCELRCLNLGNIIRLSSNEQFPADVIPLTLSTDVKSEVKNVAYNARLSLIVNTKISDQIPHKKNLTFAVNTSSIDGENRAKHKICLFPDMKVYGFNNSKLEINDSEFTLKILDNKTNNLIQNVKIFKNELIYRSCILKTASSPLICLVVSVGETSWIRQNIKKCSSLKPKHSMTDGLISKNLVCFVIGIVAVCVIISSAFKYYISYDSLVNETFWFNSIVFFIMYSVAIPISIYFFLEIIREAQAAFITNDIYLWSRRTKRPALVNTSSLNADLGSISFMVFDKTGTLTKNNIKYNSCILPSGESILKYETRKEDDIYKEKNILQDNLIFFILAILTCHSLEIEKVENILIIDGFSADEKAIVSHFSKFIQSHTDKEYSIKINKSLINVKIVHSVDFKSSNRKSTYVILVNNQLVLVTKGSDDVIIPKLNKNSCYDNFSQSVTKASSTGLRNIVYAFKILTESDLVMLRDIGVDSFESNMTLLGAANTEDQLQFKVKETIEFFKLAGIKCFMASGDKKECAVNIGRRVGILSDVSNRIDLLEIEDLYRTLQSGNCGRYEEISNQNNRHTTAKSNQYNILVSGAFLEEAESDCKKQSFLAEFLLNPQCVGVCCYRMNPKNKAFLVKSIQEATSYGKICCAVGDGSNDIGMLQQAHIGIAIYGKEGMDAVKASDYALGSFFLLKRLIFYHGQLSKQRTDRFLIASFYKTIFFCLTHFIFQILSHFSSTALFDKVSYSLFNVLWSSFAVLSAGILCFSFLLFFVGIFEKHLSAKTLMCHPKLYSCNERMNSFVAQFKISTVQAVWHSFCVVVIPYWIFRWSSLNSLTVFDCHGLFSTIIYTCLIFVINVKVLFMDAMSISLINLSSLVLTLFVWFVYLFGYGCMNNCAFLCNFLVLPETVFLIILVVFSALLLDFFCRIYRNQYSGCMK